MLALFDDYSPYTASGANAYEGRLSRAVKEWTLESCPTNAGAIDRSSSAALMWHRGTRLTSGAGHASDDLTRRRK